MAGEVENWCRWLEAVREADIRALLQGFFEALDGELEQVGVVCARCGRCCDFETWGHRLYVTGLEIAWVLGGTEERGTGIEIPMVVGSMRGCPFQVEGLCSIHPYRPMGCRVFFCQSEARFRLQELYERFQGRLRRLHERSGLPYAYMEWRAGLQEAAEVWGEWKRLRRGFPQAGAGFPAGGR